VASAAERGGGGGGRSNSSSIKKLVDDKELHSPGIANTDRRAGPGMFHISATIRPGKNQKNVEGLIFEEIAKLHSEPVTPRNLQRVRN